MRWYRRFFQREITEKQLDAELRFHLDQKVAELVAAGITPEEARRRAQLEFGGLEQVKEECRDVGGARIIESLIQDLRYGARMLAKGPGFTAVAVLTLALGIGANTAIFSAINAVMLRTLPVKTPSQLVLFKWVAKHPDKLPYGNYSGWAGCPQIEGIPEGCSFSYPAFELFRSLHEPFSGVFAFVGVMPFTLAVSGNANRAWGQFVTGEYFSTLGVQPILGREITPQDDTAGAPPVLVLSYNYWNARFAKDPAVIGKAITVNTKPFTIVGVMPPEFFGLQAGYRHDFWLPLARNRELGMGENNFTDARTWWVQPAARLRPGVMPEQAQAAATLALRQTIIPPAKGGVADVPWIELAPASHGLYALRQAYSRPLFILMSLVGLVLLIACANVANLLLARGAARNREIAVRVALGASRARLIRQLFTESLLLATMGGAAGLFFAFWGTGVLRGFMSFGGERSLALDIQPDLTVLVFTAAMCLLTGLIFGLAPAARGARMEVAPALKGDVAGSAGGKRRMRWGAGKALVALQAALSLLLLVGAGLFVRTLVNLEAEDLGFNQSRLLLFSLEPGASGYDKDRAFSLFRELQSRIQNFPGVISVTYSDRALISESYFADDITVAGKLVENVHALRVGPRFFETLEIPLVLGRSLGPQDNPAAPQVAVINEAFARRIAGHPNPVGLRFQAPLNDRKLQTEIVGVVADARFSAVREAPPPTVYLPYPQATDLSVSTFEVRTSGDPKGMIPSVRRLVSDLAKDIPLEDVKTQEEQINETIFQERMFAKLSSFFGLLALLLASTGLYGLMSYAVARRTSEIGVRMALGAGRGNVLWMVLRESLTLVAIGSLLGLAASWGATRFMATILYGVKPTDPLSMAAATLLLFGVAALAGYLPARWAAKVEPMVALRHE